jgi:hypothetical protein
MTCVLVLLTAASLVRCKDSSAPEESTEHSTVYHLTAVNGEPLPFLLNNYADGAGVGHVFWDAGTAEFLDNTAEVQVRRTTVNYIGAVVGTSFDSYSFNVVRSGNSLTLTSPFTTVSGTMSVDEVSIQITSGFLWKFTR